MGIKSPSTKHLQKSVDLQFTSLGFIQHRAGPSSNRGEGSGLDGTGAFAHWPPARPTLSDWQPCFAWLLIPRFPEGQDAKAAR